MPEPTLHTGAFDVLHNSAALAPRVIGCIRNLRVEQEINLPATFSLNLTLSGITEGPQGGLLDLFAPGDDLTIMMGRDRLSRMIVGQITAIEPRFGEVSSATIRGFDRMYRLRFGEKTRVFEDRTFAGIVEEVARSAQIVARVEGNAGVINQYVKQDRQSDYDFLLSRAEAINYELLVDGTTVVFRPSGEAAAPVKSLEFPKDLARVDLDLRVPLAGGQVLVYGFNPETNEVIRAESRGPNRADLMGGDQVGYEVGNFPSTAITVARPDVTSVEALQALADARYEADLDGFIKGSATLAGDTVLVAGVNIKLSGLSDRFDGIYYIAGAVHSYDDDTGYQTDLTLRRTGV
jgi:phage protein D